MVTNAVSHRRRWRSQCVMGVTWSSAQPRTWGSSLAGTAEAWTDHALKALRAACHTANGPSLLALLRMHDPTGVLQQCGDALTAVISRSVPGAQETATECTTTLRERGWPGDEVLARQLDTAVDERGLLVVRPDLRVGTDSEPVPDAQHAVRQGKRLAKSLVASLRGRRIRNYRRSSLGVVATLGLGRGIFQYKGIVIKGLPAWLMHRGYHVLAVPTWERKIRVLAVWLTAAPFGRDLVSPASVQQPRDAFVTSDEAQGFGAAGRVRTRRHEHVGFLFPGNVGLTTEGPLQRAGSSCRLVHERRWWGFQAPTKLWPQFCHRHGAAPVHEADGAEQRRPKDHVSRTVCHGT
ncbi:hypothetical protein M2283_000155 [Streptomyces pseudovenezuelae]|uniref:Transposase IS701-like DDE domain-containing protein n=1 Tax=Streptomyces pseudovenezuelae TaxID=67350 RepID=A0ABT6LB83_9ACTN|nr:hypothetical protein [Streptomyces pseudovenezuelae]